MSMFEVEYRIIGWKTADAFRTRDKRGVSRRFRITTEQVGTDDINEVERMAKERGAIPKGMAFHSIQKFA